MRVLITGSNGFIGKNLSAHLQVNNLAEVVHFSKKNDVSDLERLLDGVDWIVHLAGVNRSEDPDDYMAGNFCLSKSICDSVINSGRIIPIIYASSIQVDLNNEYGVSKRMAEDFFKNFQEESGNPVFIYRLPNVFGKWSKPNYNSVVATFCYNVARGLPIVVHNPEVSLRLVYIDDLIESLVSLLQGEEAFSQQVSVVPEYKITVGDLANTIGFFENSRLLLHVGAVGEGLIRALYATFISFLPKEKFNYNVVQHSDERGVFVEMIKTANSGQLSFFTICPGVTRGGHYHHTKVEKFMVIRGDARFRFRNILTGELYEIYASGEKPTVVETIPGWSHDITNCGSEELICMLWANEVFDQVKPDTYSFPLDKNGTSA